MDKSPKELLEQNIELAKQIRSSKKDYATVDTLAKRIMVSNQLVFDQYFKKGEDRNAEEADQSAFTADRSDGGRPHPSTGVHGETGDPAVKAAASGHHTREDSSDAEALRQKQAAHTEGGAAPLPSPAQVAARQDENATFADEGKPREAKPKKD